MSPSTKGTHVLSPAHFLAAALLVPSMDLLTLAGGWGDPQRWVCRFGPSLLCPNDKTSKASGYSGGRQNKTEYNVKFRVGYLGSNIIATIDQPSFEQLLSSKFSHLEKSVL